jgi:hypothetical protein
MLTARRLLNFSIDTGTTSSAKAARFKVVSPTKERRERHSFLEVIKDFQIRRNTMT